MHFVLLGMEQDRVAVPADIIHGSSSVLRIGGASKMTPVAGGSTTLRLILRAVKVRILKIKNRPLLPGRPGGVSISVGPVMWIVSGETR